MTSTFVVTTVGSPTQLAQLTPDACECETNCQDYMKTLKISLVLLAIISIELYLFWDYRPCITDSLNEAERTHSALVTIMKDTTEILHACTGAVCTLSEGEAVRFKAYIETLGHALELQVMQLRSWMRKVGWDRLSRQGTSIDSALVDLKEKIVEIVKLKDRLRKLQARFVKVSLLPFLFSVAVYGCALEEEKS